jgi:FkbM family methyltransferase
MNYKFIDIGTGHHSVSSDIFGTDVLGIYVEPIKEYLNVLPSGKNIIKENCVISEKDGEIKFNAVIVDNPKYFSNDEISKIATNKNLLDEYIKKYSTSGQSSISIKTEKSKLVLVKSMTLKSLFEKHNVTSVDYLKIDVEGHESVILKQLLGLLFNKKIIINCEIKFGYNYLSDMKKLNSITNSICELINFSKNYSKTLPWNEDLILKKNI